ncbi:AAA family ATPase [Patescibacteria group bacterium]
MLCQSCGRRPAAISIRQTVNGRTSYLHLCHTCAEERMFFGNDSFLNSFMMGGAGASGGAPLSPQSQRASQPEQVNIVEFFSERAKKVLEESAQAAHHYKARHIDTEHLLLGLLEEKEVVVKIIEDLGIKTDDLKAYIEENIQKGDAETRQFDLSPRAKKVLELAFHEARNMEHNYVGSEHILLGLIREGEGMAAQVFDKYAVDHTKARSAVINFIGTGDKPRKKRRSTTPTLDEYSRDLTSMAKEGKLDPVVGRAREVGRVVQILSRRTKNNPVLIGEPGVGKTAIAEGLAQRIVSGNIPETLKDKRVISLDLSSMIAGTKHRGDFEDRMKKVMKEIEAAKKDIVIFIDELHTIVGAGAAEGAMDASNMLKPSLSRGDLQMIGATTLDEYKKHIEKDAALERRFQPIIVSEPSVEETIQILHGLRDKYEAHHKVEISDEAIVAAASLSDRYVNDRFLPDKAIDLIDEGAAKIRLANINTPEELKEREKSIKQLAKELESAKKGKTKTRARNLQKKLAEAEDELRELREEWKKTSVQGNVVLSPRDIEEVVAESTGIPVTELAEEELDKLLKLEDRLHERVIGQNEAIKAISEAVRRGRAGLKDPNRPIGSFIFLGPTGVGKTELSKALSELIFGDEESMIRVDMSEYMEKHTVSRLVGSPPGYVGYEEGGQLTEKVRRKPYSVILLDEIEKAHPEVFNILLQIMEDGRLTDAKGRTVDFKNTIIIATSNIGSEMIQDSKAKSFGFEDDNDNTKQERADRKHEKLREHLLEELKKHFRPEFLNRVDEIIVFHALTEEQIKQIVTLMLKDLEKLLRAQNIKMKITGKAKTFLAKKGFDPSFGARPLRREIQRRIENPLSEMLLAGKFKSGQTITIDLKADELVFTGTKERVKATAKSKPRKKATAKVKK